MFLSPKPSLSRQLIFPAFHDILSPSIFLFHIHTAWSVRISHLVKYSILCNVSVFLISTIPSSFETTGLLITAIAWHSLSPPLPDNVRIGHDCQEQDRLCLSLTPRAPTIVQPSLPLVYPIPILGTTIAVLRNYAHQHPHSSPSSTILLPPQRPRTLTIHLFVDRSQ